MRDAVSRITKLIAALALAFSLLALTGCDSIFPKHSETKGLLTEAFTAYPAYSGEASAEINGNEPFFSEADLSLPFGTEVYGELDKLGRCTGAFAIVGPETMPTENRGSIGSVKPTGWQHVEYSFVDGLSLYNRCHLIAWTLTAEEANDRNLVTGTRSMNTFTVPYEQRAMNYVRNTGNHVAYRATPVFEGNNLVCTGILMEAYSLEDQGKSVKFCTFLYNVEPGVDIDYATGESALAAPDSIMYREPIQKNAAVTTHKKKETQTKESKINPSVVLIVVDSLEEATYVLNVKTEKFHTTTCENVANTVEKNRVFTSSPREEIVRAGYELGGCCNS